MPRERTTWNREEVAKRASLSKVADPYLMNQDHVSKNPPADKYTIGDPSDFAEDVHPSAGTWEAEYSGGQVKRNEIGLPEFRSDTFKSATEVEAVQKAALAVAVAKAVLPKTASSSLIEEQASRFMSLTAASLVDTYKSLVAQDQQDDEEGQDKQAQQDQGQQDQGQDKQAQQDQGQQDQGQDKQAQQDQGQDKQAQQDDQDQGGGKPEKGKVPPQFLKDKEANQDQGQQDQGQDKQASDMRQVMAQLQQLTQIIAQMQGKTAQQDDKKDDDKKDDDKKDDKLPAFLKDKEANQDQGQQDQGQDKQAAAARIQTAMAAALASGQDPVVAAMQAAQGCMTQQPMADDQLLDQMLSQQDDPMVGDMGIEMDTQSMDTGETMMSAQDDAMLSQIFANEEVDQAQQAQGQKQAHVVRTASTRTVGTRPTQGVSQLGGMSSTKNDVADLSSMWSTAPDVRGVFGIDR
jgi:hypothetical protein